MEPGIPDGINYFVVNLFQEDCSTPNVPDAIQFQNIYGPDNLYVFTSDTIGVPVEIGVWKSAPGAAHLVNEGGVDKLAFCLQVEKKITTATNGVQLMNRKNFVFKVSSIDSTFTVDSSGDAVGATTDETVGEDFTSGTGVTASIVDPAISLGERLILNIATTDTSYNIIRIENLRLLNLGTGPITLLNGEGLVVDSVLTTKTPYVTVSVQVTHLFTRSLFTAAAQSFSIEGTAVVNRPSRRLRGLEGEEESDQEDENGDEENATESFQIYGTLEALPDEELEEDGIVAEVSSGPMAFRIGIAGLAAAGGVLAAV